MKAPKATRVSLFAFLWQLVLVVFVLVCPTLVLAQTPTIHDLGPGSEGTATTKDYNQELDQLSRTNGREADSGNQNYRIGVDDLLEVSIFEAPDLNRTVRVSADGNISLPLLGNVRATGLTPPELQASLEELLRRTYMKEPHVGVFVKEMQSHAVSVFGAVKKPGVFQIRGSKTLVEVISMSEGLADDAGDTVILMRGADSLSEIEQAQDPPSTHPSGKGLAADDLAATTAAGTTLGKSTIEINLKSLLESGDPRYNVLVSPGDVVKVTRAGVVYIVGEVKKPGGYTLQTNENISVLQALALAEGLTRTSAKASSRIIRTDESTGARTEIPIDLGKILGGKAADPQLRPKDIVFVPNSTGRSALYRGSEAAISIAGGAIVYRR